MIKKHAQRPQLNHFARRVATVFSTTKTPERDKKYSGQKYMRLNFFLLTQALGRINKGEGKKTLPLFTKKIIASDNKHLTQIVKQAESLCAKQDLHLMSYKQFFLRDEFAMKRVIEWKLSKYIKGEEQIRCFIQKMKESSPASFRRHLITLLNEGGKELSQEELELELKRQEENWNFFHSRGEGGPTTISSV